ncbi:MAG: malonyl-[acyl-carrier protein] O-methyltransferase BioC [Desulfobulbaceae bacterium A2]|nr:MAG: malonyl-[acyl-carrier protein] O-methyltransferase BioC [Desulfobulbaceae bacterium A2]
MVQPDRQRLRQSFRRARAAYDTEARIQDETAARLLALLERARPNFAPRLALEAGCGTGLLSARLLTRYGPSLTCLWANDLLAEHQENLDRLPNPHRVPIHFLAGDIEQIALPAGLDLVISSSALHWAGDLPRLTSRLANTLQPDGILALALYGPDNLRELRELCGHGLDYPSLEDMRTLLAPWGTLLICQEQQQCLWFDSPLAVLRHLRRTGANALTRRGWTRGDLARFITDYQARFGGERGVPLSYHPLLLILHRSAEQRENT